MSFDLPSQSPAAPVLPKEPSAPPTFGSSPQGQKPKTKSASPTFLGAGLNANPTNTGNKTLLGQ